jgi:hypothetical protein
LSLLRLATGEVVGLAIEPVEPIVVAGRLPLHARIIAQADVGALNVEKPIYRLTVTLSEFIFNTAGGVKKTGLT